MGNYADNGVLVLQAGQRLLKSLDDDEAARDSAARRLLEVAEQSSADLYKSFGFQQTAGLAHPDAQLADDALASALIEIRTANVVLAAGQAVEAPSDGASRFKDALRSLEGSNALLAGAGQVTSFGFKAKTAERVATVSADINSASARFTEAADETLDRIVTGAETALKEVAGALSKLDPTQVFEALGKVGGRISGLADAAGRLVRRGLALLEAAINNLVSRFGEDALASVRGKLQLLWDDTRNGKYTRKALTSVFATESTKASIREILARPSLSVPSVDAGSAALRGLEDRFNGHVELLRSIINAISVGLALLAFTSIAAPTAALIAASCYATVMAAVVLVGMDFSDSGRGLQWVSGVGQIAKNLA